MALQGGAFILVSNGRSSGKSQFIFYAIALAVHGIFFLAIGYRDFLPSSNTENLIEIRALSAPGNNQINASLTKSVSVNSLDKNNPIAAKQPIENISTTTSASSSNSSAIPTWAKIQPRYPEKSRQRGETGTVGIKISVDEDGKLLLATLLQSSGHPELDKAALRAMEEGEYEKSSGGIRTQNLEIEFRLR